MANDRNKIIVKRRREAMRIINLTEQAERGNVEAHQELINLTKSMAKTANRRMKSLEKFGLNDAYSYTQFEENMEATRVVTSTQKLSLMDISILKEKALYLSKWLTYKTSTARGELTRRARISRKLRDKYDIDIDVQSTVEWQDFLKSAAFREAVTYDSEGTLSEAQEKIEEGYKFDETRIDWEAYKKGALQITELLDDGWVKIKS